MQYKTLVVCASATALAAALACSKNPETPVAPSSSQPGATDVTGKRLDVEGNGADTAVSRQQSTARRARADGGEGDIVATEARPHCRTSSRSRIPAARPCAAPAWSAADPGRPCRGPPRARCNSISPTRGACRRPPGMAAVRGRPTRTFRAPAGGYIRDNEVFDPLTNGRTAGNVFGPTTFGPNGITLLDHSSHVTYRLPVNLQEGELSMMILGADEGIAGGQEQGLRDAGRRRTRTTSPTTTIASRRSCAGATTARPAR